MSEKKVKENIVKVKFAIPEDVSSDCRDLISRLLVKEPERRISLKDVQNHPWIVKHRKVSAQSQD
jgi:aurora kinase, other